MDKWCCRDRELVEYLQTAWGVTLTSDTSLQALFFCQGSGENGKDTAFSVIEYIMGTYWRNVNFMTLAETKNHSEHRNDLADLAGAVRMVTSCESSDGHSLDEGVIKQVTGCRPIQSELLQDGFQLPLDEVVGVQATTFCAQEKWLIGIPSPDVEPQALGKLRRKSEESLLAVLRPLQLAFPRAALHGDCLFVQADIPDVQPADFSAPDARLGHEPEDGLAWLVSRIDDLFHLLDREAWLLLTVPSGRLASGVGLSPSGWQLA